MTEPVLRVRDLCCYLGGGRDPVRAVEGLSFDIGSAETFALLGESGCGKSMTALSLMRLLPISARILRGSAWFKGTDLFQLPESSMREVRGRGISMVFQEPMTSLNPVMTVGRQIMEAMNRGSDEARRRRAMELLDLVGVPSPDSKLTDYPHQLSGGMKQRVVIAIALANEPRLLIADEPTTALDVTIQAQVLDLIRDIQEQRGMSVLLITHDLGVVNELAHSVAVMYAGRLVEQGRKGDFFTTPLHPYSRRLFDSLPALEKRGRGLSVIPGFVPSLRSRPPGCPFAPRCDQALDKCASEVPSWFDRGNGRVRCHLYQEGPASAPQEPPAEALNGAVTDAPADSAQGGPILGVEGLKVYFPVKSGFFRRTRGYVRAVDGIDLHIPRGRTLALVGESGCGKTTAGKGILQLIPLEQGSVRFDGVDLTRIGQRGLRGVRSELQIVFQDPYSSMNPRMLVREIVGESLLYGSRTIGPKERNELVGQLLERVGMPADAANSYPHEFSGGQRQRISIARALAVNPKLIVCDEPTSALDVSVQAQILNLLRRLQQELGISYLFITHNLSVVAYLAHEVAVMYLGRIVEYGPAERILNEPRHPYTQALLSAIPALDQQGRREIIRLQGDLPSAVDPPNGCFFHPRCAHAMDQCRAHYPGDRLVGEQHTTACHLFEEGR